MRVEINRQADEPTVGMFSSYVTNTCAITEGAWKTCKKSKTFDAEPDETAVAFRTRFLADMDPVYIDRTGPGAAMLSEGWDS